ncbi:hypothetical protein [Amycolatopsis cynarae]|uniref:hypothetical protein n=1 Tax=Amycolatopsis cynarae TaxID=2995223 RepID=UPI002E12EF8D
MLAHSRAGVIKSATLRSLGLENKTIWRRCQPGGPWQRLLPGIVLLSNGVASEQQRVTASLLLAGPRAVVTGSQACLDHGLRRSELPDPEHVHVLVPHEQKTASTGFLTIERTVRLPDPSWRNGSPIAPLIRAVTDAARRLRNVEPVERLLIEAIQGGRCSPAALREEFDLGTTRGTALPRRVLSEVAYLRSPAEAAAKALSRRLTIQPSRWNVNVYDAGGHYVGCPDAWWDDVALAWEIDSVQFHYSRDGYARTLRRNTRYAAAGIVVVQTLPARLKTDPAGVIAELRAGYAAAAARPRPAVTWDQPG